MRVCPKCGFIDPPEWKHAKWSYHIDTISLDNFKQLYPELTKKLLESGLVEDPHYVYRISKSCRGKGIPFWVQRKAKIDYDEKLYERFSHLKSAKPISKHSAAKDFLKGWEKLHPNQTKLLDAKE